MAKDNKSNDTPSTIDVIKMAQECVEVIDECDKQMGHVNIIIAGKTGVGKSTLINAAFREKLAETGMGMPVTQSSKLIEKEGMPIRIYDTVGLELDEQNKLATIQDIQKLIVEKRDTEDPDQMIHCVWYCVQANSDRLEKVEQELIEKVAALGVSVILILTKAYLKKHAKQFAEKLSEYNLAIENISIVLAQDYDEEKSIKAYGVEDLIRKTLRILPEEVQAAWINAQTSLTIKHQQAVEIVQAAAKLSILKEAGAGFVPVPGVGIAVSIHGQVMLMTKIANVYGLQMTQSRIKKILLIMGGALGASAGKTIAVKVLTRELAKFIPGANVAAGALNAATASAMTLAFGQAYILIMEKLYTGEINEADLESRVNRREIIDIMKAANSENRPCKFIPVLDEVEPLTESRFDNIRRNIDSIFKFGRNR